MSRPVSARPRGLGSADCGVVLRLPRSRPRRNDRGACASTGAAAASAPERTALLGNLGSFGRTITTSSVEAQQFFDEGLTLLYGFNHEEAFRSFARAASLDDKAPMPHWGMALALGTNINDPAPAERIAKAYAHLAAARARAANGSAVEQALIAALAKRYVESPEGDQLARELAVCRGDGRDRQTLPRRSRCRHAVRRELDEPAPLAPVRQGWQARPTGPTPSSPRSNA